MSGSFLVVRVDVKSYLWARMSREIGLGEGVFERMSFNSYETFVTRIVTEGGLDLGG